MSPPKFRGYGLTGCVILEALSRDMRSSGKTVWVGGSKGLLSYMTLVAPFCAIPRDYLSDTPLACALWGFWCLNMANWVRYPLPPFFFERFPLGEHSRSGGAIPPPPLKRGISAILARYPMKTRQMGAIPPSAILSQKGIASDMGGYLALGLLSYMTVTCFSCRVVPLHPAPICLRQLTRAILSIPDGEGSGKGHCLPPKGQDEEHIPNSWIQT